MQSKKALVLQRTTAGGEVRGRGPVEGLKTSRPLKRGIRVAPDPGRRVPAPARGDSDDPFEVLRSLPTSMLQIPVSNLHLTTRCHNVLYAQDIHKLEDLLKVNLSEASHWRNFGVKTAAEFAGVLKSIRQHATQASHSSDLFFLAPHLTLLETVTACLEHLPNRERQICRARLGFDGRRPSLTELARTHGLSAERIRQVEARRLGVFARHHAWSSAIGERLRIILSGDRKSIFLHRLGVEDRWFTGLENEPEIMRRLLQYFAKDQFFLFLADNKPVVAGASRTSVQQTESAHEPCCSRRWA